MLGKTLLLTVNGAEVWAYVVETDSGLRAQFLVDDWVRLGISRGQRLLIGLTGKPDRWLYLAEVTEMPPLILIVMSQQLQRAG